MPLICHARRSAAITWLSRGRGLKAVAACMIYCWGTPRPPARCLLKPTLLYLARWKSCRLIFISRSGCAQTGHIQRTTFTLCRLMWSFASLICTPLTLCPFFLLIFLFSPLYLCLPLICAITALTEAAALPPDLSLFSRPRLFLLSPPVLSPFIYSAVLLLSFPIYFFFKDNSSEEECQVKIWQFLRYLIEETANARRMSNDSARSLTVNLALNLYV